MDESTSISAAQFKCNLCGIEHISRLSLMKHKKEIHTETVLPCESFKAGNCSRSEEDCWFRHPDQNKEKSSPEPQVFHQANSDPFPPDQFRIIMQMVTDLCHKVENVEKKMVTIMGL